MVSSDSDYEPEAEPEIKLKSKISPSKRNFLKGKRKSHEKIDLNQVLSDGDEA